MVLAPGQRSITLEGGGDLVLVENIDAKVFMPRATNTGEFSSARAMAASAVSS